VTGHAARLKTAIGPVATRFPTVIARSQRVRPEVGAPHRASAMGTPDRPDDRLRDEAIQSTYRGAGLFRFARNDAKKLPSRDAMCARGMPYNASKLR
jgi:hypothetical protein